MIMRLLKGFILCVLGGITLSFVITAFFRPSPPPQQAAPPPSATQVVPTDTPLPATSTPDKTGTYQVARETYSAGQSTLYAIMVSQTALFLKPTHTAIPPTDATQQWFIDLQTEQASSPIPSPSATPTPAATKIIPSSTPAPVSAAPPAAVHPLQMTVFAQSSANIRSCPRLDCATLGSFARGDTVNVTGESEGSVVNSGNGTWYQIDFRGQEAYVYSGLVAAQAPAVAPAPVQVAAPTQVNAPVSTTPPLISTVPPPPPNGSPYTCNGVDDLNCSDFSSQAEAQAHLNMCGNEDRIDGNDNDGLACESLPG